MMSHEGLREEGLYEILNISREAKYEEIRKSYLQLAMKYHPDKNLNCTRQQGKESDASFKLIQNAWEVLRDESLRKEYDEQLKKKLNIDNLNIYEHVSVDDMQSCSLDNMDFLCYECRCGDRFLVSLKEFISFKFKLKSLIIPCRSCSYFIELHLG